MNLHEYQAKNILRKYGITVQNGFIACDASSAADAYIKLNAKSAVVKAQVHAGGRGKAGGVKLVHSADEAANVTTKLIGTKLVTKQTDAAGQPVNLVFITEDVYPVQCELYLGMLIDRSSQRVTVMVSTEGGVDIEEIATHQPEKIIKQTIHPITGMQACHARTLGYQLNLKDNQLSAFVQILLGMYSAFIENDFAILEINPLVVRDSGQLVCVDAKISLDDNALFRQKPLLELRDKSQENSLELLAAEHELNFVALHGNIGCMVNGAGLAMATMDIIKLYGGEPANFLDIGGGATKERVVAAFKLLLADSQVKAILINIFGGIVRCDMVAEAIIAAVAEVGVTIPVIVRLEGNNADIGLQLLAKSGLLIITADGLADAAHKAVSAIN